MFPEYINNSFDIFTKILKVTIENYIKPLEKWMYEGQGLGNKISTFKMKEKNGFFTNLNSFVKCG